MRNLRLWFLHLLTCNADVVKHSSARMQVPMENNFLKRPPKARLYCTVLCNTKHEHIPIVGPMASLAWSPPLPPAILSWPFQEALSRGLEGSAVLLDYTQSSSALWRTRGAPHEWRGPRGQQSHSPENPPPPLLRSLQATEGGTGHGHGTDSTLLCLSQPLWMDRECLQGAEILYCLALCSFANCTPSNTTSAC